MDCPFSLKEFEDFKSLENRYPNVQIISIQDNNKSSWKTEGSAYRLNIMSRSGYRCPVWNLEYHARHHNSNQDIIASWNEQGQTVIQ